MRGFLRPCSGNASRSIVTDRTEKVKDTLTHGAAAGLLDDLVRVDGSD
jgi:hypothetical protein